MNFDKARILSGSMLKLIACTAMLLDHCGAFIPWDAIGIGGTLFILKGKAISISVILRLIGRTAFPLFAFLITEGFTHTRDKRKYGMNMLVFAFISEIPWNLIHSGELTYPSQNVFFTLSLGVYGLYFLDRFKDERTKQCISLLALLVLSFLLHADYGAFGYGFIILLYLLRDRKLFMTIIGCCTLPSRWIGGLAFIPICMYNGKRGFIHSKVVKYAFYIFYPAHLLILYYVCAALH